MTNIPFYTIGHSTHPVDDFIRMLQGEGISLVVDVRTVPRSRTNPQYNRDVLPQSLASCHVGYEHMAALGGLRGKDRHVSRDVNAYWQNESFHNYADYAMSEDFRDGFTRLCELGRDQRCVVMCAEAVWWRCHRRIIADYLLASGDEVLHIMGPGKIEPARMTLAARRIDSKTLAYPKA
ncbi:DUF488 family protein [Dyella psychrodurans]|uniref:DUF488 domain-containing protein n=1 Tax=Dyella psychrodurans TaxID=1927960 RepID=A0A370XD90_9GAMM|nr:DUF488 domain-containing protein [Dyella psychrodurans]RDS86185.1 DUF488 domain-containing protein [Dyella psychrodurans]